MFSWLIVYTWFYLNFQLLHLVQSSAVRGLFRTISVTNKNKTWRAVWKLSQNNLIFPTSLERPRERCTPTAEQRSLILPVSIPTMKPTRIGQLLRSAQVTVSENGISQETTSDDKPARATDARRINHQGGTLSKNNSPTKKEKCCQTSLIFVSCHNTEHVRTVKGLSMKNQHTTSLSCWKTASQFHIRFLLRLN